MSRTDHKVVGPSNADRTETSETFPSPVPEKWIYGGSVPDIGPNERRYYATQFVHKSKLHAKHVSSAEVVFGESGRLWIKYVSPDGETAVERSYRAAVVEAGEATKVVPKGFDGPDISVFQLSIGVDEKHLSAEERGEPTVRDRALLGHLHGIDPEGDS